MKANEFEEKFDKGESVIPYADMAKASRPNTVKRANIDFPAWMINALDDEAKRLGVTRQSLVKIWIADKLEHKIA
jgi:hypothetical protein